MGKSDEYRTTLWALRDWDAYLLAESGLPGPRANLTLAAVTNRKSDDFIALRKGLAYCWSVAVAAHPTRGKSLMEKWFASPDKDIRRVMKENLKKDRLVRMDQSWVEAARVRLEG